MAFKFYLTPNSIYNSTYGNDAPVHSFATPNSIC